MVPIKSQKNLAFLNRQKKNSVESQEKSITYCSQVTKIKLLTHSATSGAIATLKLWHKILFLKAHFQHILQFEGKVEGEVEESQIEDQPVPDHITEPIQPQPI